MADRFAPVQARDRIDAIDILRGVALFGIITANMRGFVAPRGVYFNPDVLWPSGANYVAQIIEFLFVQGKFITLFSILFGLGFAVQITRARDRGRSIAFYPRRVAILAVIGLLHWWFVWWGDILWEYSIAGFTLLLFRNRSQKFLAFAASTALAISLVIPFGFYTWNRLHPQPAGAQSQRNKPASIPPAIQKDIALYGSLNYPAIVRSQFTDWVQGQRTYPFLYLHLMARFLFGFWLWRTGLFTNLERYISRLRSVRLWAFIGGIAAIAGVVLLEVSHLIAGPGPTVFRPLQAAFSILAAPLLAFFYASCILLGTISSKWRLRLEPFAAVGRMALTNYVMQTLLLTWLFRITGLYGGIVGPLPLFFIGTVFFGAQIWFSNWWLARYQFGPLEWLWRSLTYGHLQPMRRRDEELPPEAATVTA
jgi:uncharacterized protein